MSDCKWVWAKAVCGEGPGVDGSRAAGRLCDGNAVEAELLQEAEFVGTTGALVAAVNASQILAFGRQTHVRCFGNANMSQRGDEPLGLSPSR